MCWHRLRWRQESERSQTEIRLRFQSSLTTTCNGQTVIDCPLIRSTCKKGRGESDAGIARVTEGNSTLLGISADLLSPALHSVTRTRLTVACTRIACHMQPHACSNPTLDMDGTTAIPTPADLLPNDERGVERERCRPESRWWT